MRIRQIALAATELEPVVEDLSAVLGISVCFRDPGIEVFGLHNALLPVGDTFLEVVSPIREGTAAGRFLHRRGGDGGYMVIVQSEDISADRKRMEELGVRIVWETTLPDIATIHLHPRDVGGAILSLDVARPPSSWRWAGRDWQAQVRTDVSTSLAGVELEAPEPAALARRWAEVLNRRAVADGPGWEIPLDDGGIRFVASRPGSDLGVCAVDLRVADPERILAAAANRGLPAGDDFVTIGGARFQLLTNS